MPDRFIKRCSLLIIALLLVATIFGCSSSQPASAPKAPAPAPAQSTQGSSPAPAAPTTPEQTPSNHLTAQGQSQPQTTTTQQPAPSTPAVSGELKVHFIDVGQADAILIQAPSGKSMLIDAGNNNDGTSVMSYIKNQGISKLDIVVGTHPHEDHIGGLDTVIKSLEIGQVVMPNKTHTTTTYKDVLTAIQGKGLKITTAKPGVNLDLGTDVSATVLAPIGSSYGDLNSFSAVIRLAFGNTSFMFTGDAESDSEADIISSGAALTSTVLKVSHHGSTSSTSQSFLNKVKPQHAVIMVGKGNDYGHPHQETLTKLNNIGAKIYRTDTSGNIIATSDGSAVSFNVTPTISNSTTPVPKPAPAPSPEPTPAPVVNPSPTTPTENKQSVTVYVTKTGSKYHVDGCSSLSKSKIPISLEDALKQYGPCSICKPPQ